MVEEFVKGEIEDFLDLINDPENAKQLFVKLDKDNSGILEKKEVQSLVKDVLSSKTFKSDKKRKEKILKTLNVVLERYDENKDEKISFEEFQKVMIFIMSCSIKDGIPKTGLTIKEAIAAFEKELENITNPQEKAHVQELIECMKLK